MSNPNRVSTTSPANGEYQQASPTGQPLLPVRLVPWLTVLVALAGVLPLVPGLPPLALAICGVIVSVGAALGIASPGVRKSFGGGER